MLNKGGAQYQGFGGVFEVSEGHESWDPGLHEWDVGSSQESWPWSPGQGLHCQPGPFVSDPTECGCQ